MISILLIVVGIIFLLNNAGYIAGPVWGYLWPSLLIVASLWSLLKKSSLSCKDCWNIDLKQGAGKKKRKK